MTRKNLKEEKIQYITEEKFERIRKRDTDAEFEEAEKRLQLAKENLEIMKKNLEESKKRLEESKKSLFFWIRYLESKNTYEGGK